MLLQSWFLSKVLPASVAAIGRYHLKYVKDDYSDVYNYFLPLCSAAPICCLIKLPEIEILISLSCPLYIFEVGLISDPAPSE